jgi:hypothetical protein
VRTWKYGKTLLILNGMYQVSNLGRIRGLDRIIKRNGINYKWKSRIIIGDRKKDYYIRVNLCKEGIYERFLVHRLVAEAFIPNLENKPMVNHKNGIKTDNRLENLELVTAKENTQHAIKNNLRKPQITKKIRQFDRQMNFIKLWSSAREAGTKLKINCSHIYECCQGKLMSAGGYVWRYDNQYLG